MSRNYVLLIIVIVAFLFSCNRKKVLDATTNKNQEIIKSDGIENKESTTIEIEHGKLIHQTKCNRCHIAHNPDSFDTTEWAFWVNKMAPKAKLTEDEKTQLENYLFANSKK